MEKQGLRHPGEGWWGNQVPGVQEREGGHRRGIELVRGTPGALLLTWVMCLCPPPKDPYPWDFRPCSIRLTSPILAKEKAQGNPDLIQLVGN